MTKRFFIALYLLFASYTLSWAMTETQLRSIAEGESDARIEALHLAVQAKPALLQNFLTALLNDEIKLTATHVVLVKEGIAVQFLDQKPVPTTTELIDIVNNNRIRTEIDLAIAQIKLSSVNKQDRVDAIKMLMPEASYDYLTIVTQAIGTEKDPTIAAELQLLKALIQLHSSADSERLQAAQQLSQNTDANTKTHLLKAIEEEKNKQVKQIMQASLDAIQKSLSRSEKVAQVFSGLSLGSILLLVALGLAITYGLMGVINMAHGELMMIGAYATYVVQNIFKTLLPEYFDFYLIASIPIAFLSAALMGIILERTVIRHLYGRPLETLLATWGISLILMQLVRTIFGAQNVAVENPSWMSGALQISNSLQLPLNRIFIIVFASLVLLAMVLVMNKSRMGLWMRGVTQNRTMAACVGVKTSLVDVFAFALGSGIAGLAGCALSQIGNVGPDLGQSYIVDSFMVVVLGGVGQLTGAVVAAMGLGVLTKFFEAWQGAVLAKIFVLAMIIIFIQRRPQGLFALKGRSAEA